MPPEPCTDELARARLDRVEADVADHKGDLKAITLSITASDLRSAERHATSQAQNQAILVQLQAVDARLNQPSALISLLGNKAAIGGAVTLLAALTSLAVALGYGGARAADTAPVAPVARPDEDDVVHRPDIAP